MHQNAIFTCEYAGVVDIKEMYPASTSVNQHKQPQELLEIKTEMPLHTPSAEPSSSAQSRKLPSGDLLANREEYLSIGVPLYEASVKGDWERAKHILNTNPELVRYAITENYETALHIAASAKSTKLVEKFVQNLVSLMTPQDLLLQNRSANTAFSLAAAGGNVSIAKILVEKNPGLVNISGTQELMPLYIACLYGKYEMVKYLYAISNMMNGASWGPTNRGLVLQKSIEADFFDVALKMVMDNPALALNGNVLQILARKTDSFKAIKPHPIWRVISRSEKENHAMQLLKIVWSNIVKKSKPEVDDILEGPADIAGQDRVERVKHSSGVLFIAAEMGNKKFIVELIRQYPDLIWKVNDKNQSIFHVAVSHRQEGIYNLLYEIGSLKDFVTPLTDEDGNNMLHLAGMSAKNKRLQHISGVALQMQRELLWYKEVEAMVPPSYREKANNNGLLPHELFTNEHKDLLSASEKWMKDTASQSMVVAALIATIAFAVAFTNPGGYNREDFPVSRKRAFIVFFISDAISLALATTSILMFLYILTSRYAEKDFLEALPKKLMRGLAALFLSITTMMVAFSASCFFVFYDEELSWVPYVITGFAYMPVILYVRLQYELLADVYHSTYGSKNLFKPKKHVLYY